MELKSVRFFVDFSVQSRLGITSIKSHKDSGDQIYYVCFECYRLLNLLQLDAVLLKQLPDDKVHVSTTHDEAKDNPDQQP